MSGAPSAVVTGASSQIGVFLLPLLVEAGFEVTAVSRAAPAGAVQVAGGVCWISPDPSIWTIRLSIPDSPKTLMASRSPLPNL